ncbi:MAG: hypothetical protein JWN23_3204 [Rhodocyclales bacterium]|nr:hypothetical protein [Rhodocyclales bacterium]
MFRFLGMIVVCMMLAACAAGVKFVPPQDSKLTYGVTTKEQLVAIVDEDPNIKGQKVVNGETIDTVGFVYASMREDSALPGVTAARGATYLFHKNVLVGKEFSSSFKSDSSLFDFEKAKTVKAGMTFAQVVELLGKPSGEYRFPLVQAAKSRALIYQFGQTKGFKSQINMLVVELDANDMVTKADYTQTGML